MPEIIKSAKLEAAGTELANAIFALIVMSIAHDKSGLETTENLVDMALDRLKVGVKDLLKEIENGQLRR